MKKSLKKKRGKILKKKKTQRLKKVTVKLNTLCTSHRKLNITVDSFYILLYRYIFSVIKIKC